MTQPSPHAETSTAPHRASSHSDSVADNGTTVTVRLRGASYELTNKQLEEVTDRLALENSLKSAKRSEGIAADQLKSLVERIERLEEEKAGLASDIKDIFAEAHGNGFCRKTIRKIIALRKQDAAERDEAQHLLATYCRALGMQTTFNFEPEE